MIIQYINQIYKNRRQIPNNSRFLPINNINRIIKKKAFPENVRIAKVSKETAQECIPKFTFIHQKHVKNVKMKRERIMEKIFFMLSIHQDQKVRLTSLNYTQMNINNYINIILLRLLKLQKVQMLQIIKKKEIKLIR